MPRLLAITWAAIYLKDLPVPNEIQNSWTGSCCTQETAKTTTYVSTVRTATFCNPSFTASATCKNMQLSASSCWHGAKRLVVNKAGLVRTPCPSVMYIFLPSSTGCCCTNLAKKWKNAVLISPMHRNACQSLGQSKNVFAASGLSMFTTAGPSLTRTWVTGASTTSGWGHTLSRQLIRSDLVPCRSLTVWQSWGIRSFSCWKKNLGCCLAPEWYVKFENIEYFIF